MFAMGYTIYIFFQLTNNVTSRKANSGVFTLFDHGSYSLSGHTHFFFSAPATWGGESTLRVLFSQQHRDPPRGLPLLTGLAASPSVEL